jgi:23S rRNA (guanosine2251-2'-O)-methyltransferase
MSKRPYVHYPRNDRDKEPQGRAGSGEERDPNRRRDGDGGRGKAESDGPLFIYGVHAADAALRNPARTIRQIMITENAENRMKDAIAARDARGGVKVNQVTPRDLDRKLGADTVHQGVVLEVEPLPEPTLEQLADMPEQTGPLIVLDQVTDPHNVGAILRSAAVFGAQGLIMTRRHSPPLGGALAKVASGALEHVPIVLVPNLARALAELGKLAYHRIGLDGTGAAAIDAETFSGNIAIILGAEGRGLRQLTQEHCDVLARISGSGPLGSLNVSNAAAVTLHLAAMRRGAIARSS